MKKQLITLIALIFSSGLFAQGVYNNGAKIVIGSGVTLYVSGNYQNETNVTDGSLDLSGTLKLTGNYTNNAAAADAISAPAPGSRLELIGTSPQTLGGTTGATFTFPDLTINNSAGVTITKNAVVTGVLTLTSGLTDIGNNNFTFGPLASVAGTPSTTAMVIATGTGEMRKSFSSAGSFTFPVGDNTGTSEYSPVTITLNSGTFASGAYVGLNLVNAPFNEPTITGSYLNRFWNITQTGITGFTGDAVFQYVPADVTGTEASIYGLKVLPTPITALTPANTVSHQLTASGLTSFGTFTGGPGNLLLSLKVFLEGPYAGGSVMNTGLNPSLIQHIQPYSAAPWSYGGTESVSSVPGGVVDWVLVELRDAANAAAALPGTALAGWPRAFLLKSDGTVVDVDGTSQPNFRIPQLTGGNLFVIVRHRNSLAIMSATGATPGAGVYSYDFSTALAQAYGGGTGYKQLETGVFGMVVGDIDHDGNVFVSDYNVWAAQFGLTNTYSHSDLDQDGSVFVSDYNKWAANFGNTTINPALLKSAELKPKYVSNVPK